MAKRPSAPPSAVSGKGTRRVDVRGWLGGIRVSGFAVVMLGLVVLGAFVLVPTAGTYLAQQQRIAFLREAVQVSADEVAELERERERWNDDAYVAAQARERLYYTYPGEVNYLVVDDLDDSELPREPDPVSPEVEETEGDWMGQLLRSVVASGLAESAVSEDETVDGGGVFQPDDSTGG
ncbi:FtsB family cell division protein [Microbacterium gilvum]|uniref:Septum formation initiator n=1 Tax=Microbacterium gilvum TaxID=1336204 RepID=A0ABP8ZXP0_9MICO